MTWNRNLTVIAIAPLAAIALAAPAHADGIDSLTCDAVTFTAPAGTHMVLGIDAEPPGSLDAGQTATISLFPYVGEHDAFWIAYSADPTLPANTVIGRGVQTVDGCAALALPPDAGYDTIGSKVAGTPAAHVTAAAEVVARPVELVPRFGRW